MNTSTTTKLKLVFIAGGLLSLFQAAAAVWQLTHPCCICAPAAPAGAP